MRRLIAFALLLTLSFANAQDKKDKDEEYVPIPTIDLKRTDPIDYAKDILPIFEAKCFVCHSEGITKGKFDMSTYEKLMKGGAKRGNKVVIPGKANESFLYLACSRQ